MHAILINAILAALTAFLIGLSVYVAAPKLYAFFARIFARSTRGGKVIFLLGVSLAALYGGSKHINNVTYPLTDPDVWFMRDNGSCSSNDVIYISFTRNVMVPRTAQFYVDGYPSSITNVYDIVTNTISVYSNTFSNVEIDGIMQPFFINFANATNYNFLVYTDWTQPITIHTNGVAYVAWQIGHGKQTNDIVIFRTGIYTNGFKAFPSPAITNGPSGASLLTTTLSNSNGEETNE